LAKCAGKLLCWQSVPGAGFLLCLHAGLEAQIAARLADACAGSLVGAQSRMAIGRGRIREASLIALELLNPAQFSAFQPKNSWI
jgi:hypothetical protein